MMLLDELLDLRRDLGAIETHHEQLTQGSGSLQSVTYAIACIWPPH